MPTPPITVTSEMRQAVYDADCSNKGHRLRVDSALQLAGTTASVQNVDGLIPYIICERCGKVWLVVEVPGNDYVAAELQYNNSLLPENRKPPRVKKP